MGENQPHGRTSLTGYQWDEEASLGGTAYNSTEPKPKDSNVDIGILEVLRVRVPMPLAQLYAKNVTGWTCRLHLGQIVPTRELSLVGTEARVYRLDQDQASATYS